MKIKNDNLIGQKFIAYTLGFFVISFISLFFFSNKAKASEVPLFEKAIIDSNGFIEINDSNKTKSLIGLGFNSLTTIGSLTADNLLDGWVSNNGFNIIKDLSNLDNGSYSVYPAWYIGEYTEYFWLNGKVGDFVNREIISPHYHKSFSYNTTNVGNLVLFYSSTSTGGGDRNYRGLSYWDLYDYQTPLNYTDYPNWTNQEFLAGQITTSDSVENLAFTHPDYISLGANFIELEFTPNRVPGGSADPLLDYNIVVDRTKTLDYEFDSGVAENITINYNFCNGVQDLQSVRVALRGELDNSDVEWHLFENYWASLFFRGGIGDQSCSGSKTFPVDVSYKVAHSGRLFFNIVFDFINPVVPSYVSDIIEGNYIYNSTYTPFLDFSVLKFEDIRKNDVSTSTTSFIPGDYDFCESGVLPDISDKKIRVYFTGQSGYTTNREAVNLNVKDFLLGELVLDSCLADDFKLAIEHDPSIYRKGYLYMTFSTPDSPYFLRSRNFSYYVHYGVFLVDEEMTKVAQFVTSLGSVFEGFMYGFITPLKVIFPFNFVSVLSTSWDKATYNNFESGAFGLELNENNNLIISLPLSSSSVEVFGKEFFYRDEKTMNFFLDIRAFSRWLILGAVWLVFYKLAKIVYNKINGHTSMSSSDKNKGKAVSVKKITK